MHLELLAGHMLVAFFDEALVTRGCLVAMKRLSEMLLIGS